MILQTKRTDRGVAINFRLENSIRCLSRALFILWYFVNNWLINNYNQGVDDFEIITGNSEQMKQIVKNICAQNGFRDEDNWNGNSGSLLVSIDRL